MAAVKFSKEDREWQAFNSFYHIVQTHYIPDMDNRQKYVDETVKAIDAFVDEYGSVANGMFVGFALEFMRNREDLMHSYAITEQVAQMSIEEFMK